MIMPYIPEILDDHTVVTSDINNDGKSDLIIMSNTGNFIMILFNSGNGTFNDTKITYFDRMDSYVFFAKFGDMNNDQKQDILIPKFTQNITLFYNNGSDLFSSEILIPTNEPVRAITLADLNNDGWLDIIGVHTYEDSIEILLNNGDSNFTHQIIPTDRTKKNYIISADVNNDNMTDIILSGSPYRMFILFNDGNNNFTLYTINLTIYFTGKMVIGDFNNDNKVDMIFAYGFNKFKILFYANNGIFTESDTYLTDFPQKAFDIGDFNHDGKLDIILVHEFDTKIKVFFNKGNGIFNNGTVFEINYIPRLIKTINMNNDQIEIIVIAMNNIGMLSIHC
jgi:hypothetical protein